MLCHVKRLHFTYGKSLYVTRKFSIFVLRRNKSFVNGIAVSVFRLSSLQSQFLTQIVLESFPSIKMRRSLSMWKVENSV